METRHLKYFIDVANTLSFTKAAQMNHVVQTTMSQNIVALENQLGFKLFERNNRSVKLTKTGELFYQDALKILASVTYADNHIVQLKRGLEGFLTVGYIGEHTMRFMPGILREYREKYPSIGIDLIQSFPSKLTSLMEEDTCDVVFTIKDEFDVNDYEEILCDIQNLYVVVPHHHVLAGCEKVRYEDILSEPMVFFHPSHGHNVYNNMVYNSVKGGYNPNIVGYASDPRSLIMMVEIGQGITILPKSCDMGHKGGVKFIRLEGANSLSVVARCLKRNSNPALPGFMEILRSHYPKGSRI